MIAKLRTESGASERNVSPSGVSAKEPGAASAKTPRLANSRSTRYKACESAPTAWASSSLPRGTSPSWSATPSNATTPTAWLTQ